MRFSDRRVRNQTNAKDRQNILVVAGLLSIVVLLLFTPGELDQTKNMLISAITGGLLTFLNQSSHQETGSTDVSAANVENVTVQSKEPTKELREEDLPKKT